MTFGRNWEKAKMLHLPTQAVNQETLGITLWQKQLFCIRKSQKKLLLSLLGLFFLLRDATCPKEEVNPLSRVKIDHAKWVAQYPDSDPKATKQSKV